MGGEEQIDSTEMEKGNDFLILFPNYRSCQC